MTEDITKLLMSQAYAHLQAGRYKEAAQHYEQVLALNPEHYRARASLGGIALQVGQLGPAEYHLSTALKGDPSLYAAANLLAMLYGQTNRHQLGCDLLRQAIARVPGDAELHFNLGNLLLQLSEYAGAQEAYEAALRINPNYPEPLINLARMYRLTLRQEVALECLRRAAEIDPTPMAHSNLLFDSMFSPMVSGPQLAALADAWDARYAAPLLAEAGQSVPGNRDPERPLKIGYVGPIFRQHPIGWLIEPVLAQHDRQRFIPYCYSDVTAPDDVTERFRALAAVFRPTIALADEQLAQTIRHDGIDILVDLNLHLDRSRLRLFARRAAPVQVNYLAYPFTCGLRTMDYRVTDAVLDPASEPALGPEAVIRLRSSFWLYRPNPAAPPVAPRLPARDRGTFTFASMNYTQKLNPGVANVWARIMNRLPDARLILLTNQPIAQKSHLARLFGDAGLDFGRVELIGTEPLALHLRRYLDVDLCLDSFPYGGHTTTLDACWMGVPVLSLVGPVSYTRGAASIESRLGLDELLTHTPQEYEETAIALATDLDRLDRLRQGLRERMRGSVLCDEAGFVADYERALRFAWRRYCEGLPPAEIDLSRAD